MAAAKTKAGKQAQRIGRATQTAKARQAAGVQTGRGIAAMAAKRGGQKAKGGKGTGRNSFTGGSG